MSNATQAGPIRYPLTSNVAYTKPQAPLVYSPPDIDSLSDQDDDDEYIDINLSDVESDPGDSDDDFMLDPPLLRMRQRIDNLVSHLQREQERARLSEDRVVQLESRLGPLQKAHAAEQAKVKTAEKLAYTAMEQAAASDKCAHEAQNKQIKCEGLLIQRNNSIEALRQRENELNAQLEKQVAISVTLRTQLGEERAAAHAAETHHQDTLKASQNDAENKIRSVNNSKEGAEADVRRLTLVVEDLQKVADSATEQLRAERQRICQFEESSEDLKRKSSQLEDHITTLNRELETLRTQKDQAELKAKNSDTEVIKLRQKFETAEFSLASETTRAQVAGLKLQESERHVKSLEGDLKGSHDKLKDVEQTLKTLERRVASDKVTSNLKQLEVDKKGTALAVEIEQLKKKVRDAETQRLDTVRQANKEALEAKQKLEAAERKVEALNTRLGIGRTRSSLSYAPISLKI